MVICNMLQQQSSLYLQTSPKEKEYQLMTSSPTSNSVYRMDSPTHLQLALPPPPPPPPPAPQYLQDSPKNIRFEVIMEAPTAAAQKHDETPLTYLNKGQTYHIVMKDTHQFAGYITSTIMIMFHDENHRKTAPNYWKFWQTQQNNPLMARAIDIELTRSSGLHQVECQYFDRITFRWYGNKGASLLVKFNCLSTDFSRIKGVKGIPLRLHMESNINDDYIERTYCRIKLFRDKGAERKNKDDAKHIERQLEKLRGKHGEPHPLWLTYSQALPYTLFQEVDARDIPTLYHGLNPHHDRAKSSPSALFPSPSPPPPPPPSQLATSTITTTSSASSITTVASNLPCSSPSPTSHLSHHQQQLHHHMNHHRHMNHSHLHHHPQAPAPMTPVYGGQKRHHRYLTDPGYSLPLQPSMFQSPPLSLQPPPPPPPPPLTLLSSSSSSSSGSAIAMHLPLTSTPSNSTSTSAWLTSSMDIDPDYIPQKRHRVAKLNIFVRFDHQSIYRAIYLEELTIQHLKEKLISKMQLKEDDQIKDMVRQVATKDLLVTMDDDAMVQDIQEQQDMLVQTRQNDDGSLNLLLIY